MLRQCPPPTTISVSNTNDSGAGSFRQAIIDSNNTPGVQTIIFGIGTGAQTISPLSQLPDIADPVVIDGTTQPGYAGAPLIELTGTSAGANAKGLNVTAANTTIRALIINLFASDGINLNTNGGNTVAGCYIGTNAAGTAAAANGGHGIAIIGVAGNTIGGTTAADRNVISGNGVTGVLLQAGANSNAIVGNYIGTDATGTAAIANINGIEINGATTNAIGGTTAGAGNLISGNTFNGVFINNNSASNTIEGNRIGTNAAGSAAIANGNIGVRIIDAANNTVGGTSAARNIISGNASSSVGIENAGSTGNKVQGNYIGTDIDGGAAIGNGAPVGIASGASGNLIGGTAAGEGNIISGNLTNGVAIFLGAHDNRVEGNRIGVNAGGAALGNLNRGIFITDAGTNNNTIGGTTAGAGNIIANNGADGISVAGGTGNAIRGNTITANGTTAQQLGIDLIGADGVDANDAGDADSGPNNLQNFPVLSSAITTGGNTTITGTLNSTPNTTFVIDFFSNPACDASGNGEGQTYLGLTSVTTDAVGNGNISATINGVNLVGLFVTATATDPVNNTSEFSPCITGTNTSATTVTWLNAAGGNWNNAANWQDGAGTNRVPGAGDDVFITTPGTYTVTLDISTTVNSLTLGGANGTQTFDESTRGLTLDAASTVNANGVFIQSGTLNGAGTITVNGTFNHTGSLAGTGALNINAGATLNLSGSQPALLRTVNNSRHGQLQRHQQHGLWRGRHLQQPVGRKLQRAG